MKKILIAALGVFCLQQGFAQTKIDRSKKPVAGPAPVITIKDPAIFNLPNGMTVLVVENHKFPKVRASLTIDAGPIYEGKKAGVLDMMGQMLGEGTTSMTKDKFDEAVDAIGADVNLSASGGSASALTRYFEKAFMLMSDALRNPSFPQASFDKIKTQTLTSLKSSEKSASAISARVNTALNYGKETAQGEFTTEESVKALVLADVQTAYKDYITPSRSYLTIVGDITPDAAKALVTKALGSWTGKQLTLAPVGSVKNPDKTEIDFVDLPTAVQGELNMGNVVNNPMNGTDYFPLLLANQILGGGADSKLFMNLREKHGFTYGSYSSIGSGRFQSLFRASAAVRTDKVDSAINEIAHEIINMRDGNITPEELNTAKAIYNGSFALRMENPAVTASYASNILINNLPKDFYSTYLQKINAVTIDDIKRVAKNYFNETNSRIVIVGNGDKILPNLAKLGFPIKKYDKFANPVVDKPKDVNVNETVKTSDAISAYDVVENYLKAMGGKDEVKKVNTILTNMTMAIGGRDFAGINKAMNPSKSVTEMKMGPMTVYKSSFNGVTGYTSQMGPKKDMTPDEIKEALDERGVINQLHYNSADFKTDYLGTGKAGSEDCYKIKVVKPSGKVAVEFYAIKSGLLLKEESINKEGQSSTVEYNDYRKVGNYMFPFEIIRTSDDQSFTMKIKEIKINEGVTEDDFK
jgi:predicted Zn-dependent peptidase